MTEYGSLDVRPYQLSCLICRQGRLDETERYPHESRLDAIQAAVAADPLVPLTLRCETDTIFRFQNPGRDDDTPEGESYNRLRDLTVLQRIGLVPGATLPASDILTRILEAIPCVQGVCCYPEAEAPVWPRCRHADSGNYERGVARGLGAIIPQRTHEEMERSKRESAAVCCRAGRLRIRPFHLLCMTCFHDGRDRADLAPIPADNLQECIVAMQKNPEMPVELIHGPCMVCPPCKFYRRSQNLCGAPKSMGLRDEKKELDTLRLLGLSFGDVLPARELMQRLYGAIASTTQVCGHGDGIERGREWSVCGGAGGSEAFVRGREAGLGVGGVAVVQQK